MTKIPVIKSIKKHNRNGFILGPQILIKTSLRTFHEFAVLLRAIQIKVYDRRKELFH